MLEFWQTLRLQLPGLWMHRWWGLLAAVMVGVAGSVLVYLVPNRYAATARVYVDTQSILKPLMTGMAVQPNLDQQVSLIAKTLINRPNIEQLMRMADLDLGTFGPEEREATIDNLTRSIRLDPTPGNNIYNIEYRNVNPVVAQKVVQSLLTIFVESNLGGKRRDTDQAQKFIETQITILEQRLAEAENRLKDFKIRNIDVMPNLAADYVTRTGEAQKDLQRTRLELRQAEQSRDALRRQLEGERPAFQGTDSASPASAARRATALELRADAARLRLAELKTKFTDQHPDVVDMRSTIQQLDKDLESERRQPRAAAPAAVAADAPAAALIPNKVYQDLRVSVADAEAKVASLRAAAADAEQRMREARDSARTIPKIEVEYAQLNRDYETNRKSYQQLIERRDSVRITGSMDAAAGVGEMRVIDPPRVSPSPVSPNRALLLCVVLLVSLAAGLSTVFLRDQGQPRFFDLRTLRKVTNLPVLGSISRIEPEGSRVQDRLAVVWFSAASLLYLSVFVAMMGFVLFKKYAF